MGILICPYCAVQLKEPVPACPDCGRPQPERGPPEEFDYGDEPPAWLRNHGRRFNGLADRFAGRFGDKVFFWRAFLVCTALAAVGVLAEAVWRREASGLWLVLVSPGTGLFLAGIVWLVVAVAGGIYDLIAGPDPRQQQAAPDERSAAWPDGDKAQEGSVESIRPPRPAAPVSVAAIVPVSPEPLPDPGPEAAKEDAAPVAPPDQAEVFIPFILVAAVVAFAAVHLVHDSIASALGAAACLGVPVGFVLGALAVRWSRNDYRDRQRRPKR